MKYSPIEVARQLETPVRVDNEVQAVLRAALERLGPNGEHWHQGSTRMGDNACAMTSVGLVLPDDKPSCGPFSRGSGSKAGMFLSRAAAMAGCGCVAILNDRASSFSEVQPVTV